MAETADKPAGLLPRLLGGITGVGARKPRLALWCMVLLGCAAAGIAICDLKLRTSRSDLLAPDQAWQDYEQSFSGNRDIIVVVRTPEPNASLLQNVLDDLAERLEREPEHFADILYRVDQTRLRRKGLQYLSEDELRETVRQVSRLEELLHIERHADQLRSRIRRASLRRERGQMTAATSGSQLTPNDGDRAIIDANRLAASLDSFLIKDGQRLRIDESAFTTPWPDLVSVEMEHSLQDADVAYLLADNNRVGLLHVNAAGAGTEQADQTAQETVARLREHLDEVQAEYRDGTDSRLTLSMTGMPVLEQDEVSGTGADMLKAVLIAFVGVGLLLTFGLRGVRHPTLVLIMLINSVAVTLGIATLVVGHLNILSVCFVAIVIGLGVDFGIHFVSRYLALRQELYEPDESIVLTGQSVGSGILTSALTTAVAFGSAALTGYPGLAELGIIAAAGILVCALMTFLFLPALISLADEKVDVEDLPVPLSGDAWRSALAGWPRAAVFIALIGIVAVGALAVKYEDGQVGLKVDYDANLLHMQDHDQQSVLAERTLTQAGESVLYAVAIAGTRDETVALREKLLELHSVARVTDLPSQLPAPPSQSQVQLIDQLRGSLGRISANSVSFRSSGHEVVGRSLDSLYGTLRKSGNLQATEAAAKLDRFLNRFVELRDPRRQTDVVDAYQSLMVKSLLKELDQVSRATSVEPVEFDDLPVAWRDRYYQVDGDDELWLLKIYPRQDVWDEAALETFVTEVRSVAPNATGAPIQNYDSASETAACYQSIAVYSLVAICLFLLLEFLRPGQKLLTLVPPGLIVGFIGYTMVQRNQPLNINMLVGIYAAMVAFIACVFDFRNLRDTLIAMIPAVGGMVMLLGIMSVLQVDFNPVNLIVIPLILGIGVDDGIHLVHDYRRQLKEGADSYKPSGETVNGVLLTSLTSVIGFGSLMIASHSGLRSVGVILSVGITCCMAVALVFLPPLLVLVARNQPSTFEPVVIKREKKASDESEAASGDGEQSAQPERKLSRKERRRQQQAA